MNNSQQVQPATTYNVSKMLEGGATKYLEKGEWIVFIEQVKSGFAEYNFSTDKMKMIGCSNADRELIASYLN